MRTLQEKYNGVNEGAFSKDQFLRDARLQLPNLVTQYNGYDDAVQILKNRGMIQEEKSEMSTAELMKKLDEMPAGELAKDIFKGVSKDVLDGLKNLAKKGKKKLGDALVKFGYLEPGDLNEAKEGNNVKAHMEELIKLAKTGKEDKKSILAKFAGAGIKYKVTTAEPNTIKYWNDKEGLSGEIKLKETVKEARLTKSNLTDYRYKATNDMDKYPYEQILRGLRVELEGLNVLGTPTPEQYTKALAKVLKNLEKDGIFYTNQIAGIKANRKRTDLMIDATPKTVVDKENGMQKAALKEAIKGVIKNILKESPKSLMDPDLYDADEEREERRKSYNDQGDFGDESDFGDYYPEGDEEVEEDVYEMYADEDENEGVGLSPEIFEDLFETDRENDDAKLARYEKYTYTLDGKVVTPEIGYYNNYLGAELDGKVLKLSSPSEDGVVQLKSAQGKTGMYTEGTFESVSLKDILD